jgi:hypothetical protein
MLMEDNITITKNRKLPPSMDYELLRKEGMQHIENLGHNIWNDYNTHDPGTTILEALCYAITELGYRCGFDMKDLLTDDKGNIHKDQTFFTAKNILTVNPLTKTDYRKLLVDLNGIQNAWLLAAVEQQTTGLAAAFNEAPVYINCAEDKLDYKSTNNPLLISGLYRVLLSLDYDDKYGDLNNGDIVIENPLLAGRFQRGEFFFTIELPAWKKADFELAKLAGEKNNIDTVVINARAENWQCDLKLNGIATVINFGIAISKKPASGKVSYADVQDMFNDKAFIAKIFTGYLFKITKAQNFVRDAVKTLHEHRNLCEDFVSVTTIDDDEIAFCFDLDVKPSADIEKIQAEIFYALENYLNPPVHFYPLKELLGKKFPVEEIFSGPILSHGFIDTEQIKSTNLRTEIYTSDIINLLMDIDGVIAIRNFQMTKYGEDGLALTNFKNLKWCMPVTPMQKPVLKADKSKILLFKNQFPFIARYDEVRDTILLLHAIHSRNKLNGSQDDISIPPGAKRDTETYWPIQYDFPQTYGIGEAGLPLAASAERVAQQQQLKAYLMFYEQLLADFLSQLTNAYQLFSTSDLKQTYFAQFLSEIKDIDAVYKPDKASTLLKTAIETPDSVLNPKNEWQKLYESKDLFDDRRNRFLDHLLARFAESFNDYALMMYKINYEQSSEEKINYAELRKAKIKTLETYNDISSNRDKAFNYFPQIKKENLQGIIEFLPDTGQYWDTDNISGLEKRISTLTGIEDYKRRFLYCIKIIEIICSEKEVEVNGNKTIKCFHSFSVTSRNGIRMISKDYENKAAAEEAMLQVVKDGVKPENYSFENDGKFLIKFANILISTNRFDTEQDAKDAVSAFVEELSDSCKNPVGLHLIEHILLRPRTDTFDLMQVCLHDCDCPCEFDPYSFRASVVLPYWPGHFDNIYFREYFENKIREETPAHVMLKVCWLNNDLMREFEIRYNQWIKMLAAYSNDNKTNEAVFISANNKMIDILSNLHSEYPQATLHNCDESKEGSNTVILNKTVLGTFKN